MSTPQSHRAPLEVRERPACMCAHGAVCSSFSPGHALHLIQARLASATPSDWVDAIVDAVDAAAGEIVLRPVATGERVVVWSASEVTAGIGEPVAFHRRYRVLSVGRRAFNVALLS